MAKRSQSPRTPAASSIPAKSRADSTPKRSPRTPIDLQRAQVLGHAIDRVRVEPTPTLRTAPDAMIQREMYTAQAPINNVTPSVKIQETVNGNRGLLEITDETRTVLNVGELSGYLDYIIGDDDLTLRHVETHPPRMGLGALLLYQLALTAQRLGLDRIAIGTPAATAVNAYLTFGARASNQMAASQLAQRHYDRFTEVGHGHRRKQIGMQALQPVLARQVEEEANHRLEKARYFNPTMTNQQANDLKEGYLLQAMERLDGQGIEAAKQGTYLALSRTGLEFDATELRRNAGTRVTARWNQTTVPLNIQDNYL